MPLDNNTISWLAGSTAVIVVAVVVAYIVTTRRPDYGAAPAPVEAGPRPPRLAWLASFWCSARQVLRRFSWFLLLPLALYGVIELYNWQIASDTRQAAQLAAASGGTPAEIAKNAAQAASIAAAKVVDPSLIKLKLGVAVVVFLLIMGLGWGGLNLAMPVVPDWATSRYSDPDTAAAAGLEGPVVGFKRSFLRQSDGDRVRLLLGFFSLFVLAASIAVWAGFSIQ